MTNRLLPLLTLQRERETEGERQWMQANVRESYRWEGEGGRVRDYVIHKRAIQNRAGREKTSRMKNNIGKRENRDGNRKRVEGEIEKWGRTCIRSQRGKDGSNANARKQPASKAVCIYLTMCVSVVCIPYKCIWLQECVYLVMCVHIFNALNTRICV